MYQGGVARIFIGMKFVMGIIVGIAIALGTPAGAADAPPQTGDGSGVPGPELALGECSSVKQVDTFTVTNDRGATRVVTKATQNCGGGYTLVTRYRSPWVTQ